MTIPKELFGKSLLIGREPGQGRLLIAVEGTNKVGAIGAPNSVPGTVSRCLPAEGKAHCKIEVGFDGNMIVRNLKEQNQTYVDGAKILQKRVKEDNTLQLGGQHYSVTVDAIITAVTKLLGITPPPPSAKEFSIRPLKMVWSRYQEDQKAVLKERNRIAMMGRIPMMFTLGSGVLATLAKTQDWGDGIFGVTIVMSVVGLALLIYGLYLSANDQSIDKLEELKDQFERDYVCPNPDCRHYQEGRKYTLLLQDGSCRYCRCKFTDK